MYTTEKPSFTIKKVGFKGVKIIQVCFRDGRGFRLLVLRFYGQVNPTGSCRVRPVYLTTLLLSRLSSLSG